MAEQDRHISEAIIKDGNSFLLRFVIAFTLITFLIVPRPPEAQRKVNGNVGEGQNLINSQRGSIQEELKHTDRDIRDMGTNRLNTFAALSQSAPRTSRDLLAEQNQLKEHDRQLEQLVKTQLELREKLIKLDEDFVTLEKARVVRQVALPGTSFSLMESDVRLLYPGALAGAMLWLLNYRRRLLKSLENGAQATLPFWAAPVPLWAFGQSFWSTVFLNLVGLTFVGLLLSFYMDFTVRDEFYPELRVAILQLLVGYMVAFLYGFESIRAVGKSFTKLKGLDKVIK